VVIGGGVSGLVACAELERAGCAPILLEQSDVLGGRLKTDVVDGVPVDHGFQVLLTAYPEVKRLIDIPSLDPIQFDSGARIFRSSGGAPVLVGDPRRKLSDLGDTLRSGVVSASDAFRMLSHLRSVRGGKRWSKLFSSQATSRSTFEMLEAKGYSVEFIDEFLRPFFGGIFLDRDLKTPESMFNFVLRMFATGSAVLPRAGMQAVVAQLVAKLDRTEIRRGVRAVAVDEAGTEMLLAGGERMRADGVILAVPGLTRDVDGRLVSDGDVSWNRTVRYVWSVSPDVRRFERPLIGLTPGSKRITNMHFFRDLDESWPDWVSVTVVGDPTDVVDIADDKAMRVEFQHASGIAVRETIASHDVRQALPVVPRQVYEPDPEATWLIDGVLKAGDDRSNPSFNGAARAGVVAAEALVKSWD
jgi:phytoene dehydrogenase-like protein